MPPRRAREPKHGFMSSNITKIYAPPKPKTKESEAERKQEYHDEKLLKSVLREVDELGGSQLHGRKRKDWEKRKRSERGQIEEKAPRAPFKVREGMRKKKVERDEKHKERELATGMYIAPKIKKRKYREREGGLRGSVGTFSGGVLHVPRQEIARVQRSSAKGKRRR